MVRNTIQIVMTDFVLPDVDGVILYFLPSLISLGFGMLNEIEMYMYKRSRQLPLYKLAKARHTIEWMPEREY